MAQGNAEVVRCFFQAIARLLQTWRPEGSLVDAMKAGDIPPEAVEALGYMSAEAEWNPVFSSETYRGRLEMARGWDELLEAAESYRLELLEVTELDDDRVLGVFGPSLEGRSSGIHVNAAVFGVVTLRDGLIVRLDEYTDRREALEAVGRREQATSRDNERLARRGYEALAAGDLEGVLALVDEDVEVEVHTGRPDLPETQTLRGHAGFLENIRQLTEVFEDIQVVPEEFVEAGDDLVVLIHTTGHGKTSGIKVENRVVHVWTFRAGKAARLQVFLTKEEALAAVGLEASRADR